MGGKRGQLAILGVRRGDARAVLDIGKVRGKCEPAAPSPATRIANEVSRDAEGVGGVDGVQEYRRDPQEYVSENVRGPAPSARAGGPAGQWCIANG